VGPVTKTVVLKIMLKEGEPDTAIPEFLDALRTGKSEGVQTMMKGMSFEVFEDIRSVSIS
jgi:hypothetical protein